MEVLHEDNHIIVINKAAGEIVQGDKTGDASLCDKMKAFLKEKYAKPGNVFVGLPHRLDRPVSGIVIFAKTSKALERLNEMFRAGSVKKIYWAITKERPAQPDAELECWILRNEKMNKSFAYKKEVKGAKKAQLHYTLIGTSQNYNLIEVELKTGRHHQIRVQFANAGCPLLDDNKYNKKQTKRMASLGLFSYSLTFIHPLTKKEVSFEYAPNYAPFAWFQTIY